MNRMDQDPEAMLDSILEEIRADQPDDQVIADVGRRAWKRIAAGAATEAITSCAGFQALFPEYRNGSLNPARRMLVEDHLHECVACRKAMQAVESPAAPKVVTMPAAPPKRSALYFPKWAVAAVLLIGVGLASWFGWLFGTSPNGSRGRLLASDGAVYRLQGNTLVPVAAGAELQEREVLRTAGGGHASVRLIDGSTVEVGERAEMYLTASRRDTTVYLDRGQIIVQAAKRRTGHLYVASPDSRVAVTGTIFSVNRGLAGSRVSVVEGEVHVEHGSQNNVLHAGDQVATHPSIAKTAIADEISWSRNYDQYLALLKKFVEIKGKLSQVHMPGLRYSSRLIDSVPEGTNIYVSLPNLGPAIDDLQRIVTEQARQSPELQQWMKTQLPEFEKVTSRMTRIGEYLGDEIVLAAQSCKGFCPVLIAESARPGLREYVNTELAKLTAEGKPHSLRIVEPADVASLRPDQMSIVFSGNKVVIGEQPQFVRAALVGASRFSSGAFGKSVSDIYRRGAGLFVAANLEEMFRDEDELSPFGFSKVRHLIAEQKQVNGKAEYSAVLSFSGEREGVASWLASPGAMGSLGFVSPDAQFATSFVVKQPAQMMEDMLALGGGPGDHSRITLEEFQKAFGISLEQLASYVGGEVTVALDGPVIPVPSWKVVAEVRNAAALQSAFNTMIASGNTKLAAAGQSALVLKEENANGRTYYSIRVPFGNMPVEVHYVYVDGYLLAAPNRTLLDRAMRDRLAGTTLARSQEFTKLLPRDDRASFSGMVYQNAGELMRLVGQGASAVKGVTPEQQKAADEIAKSVEPMLICLYGENDRIEIASQGDAMNLLMQTLAGKLYVPGQNQTPNPGTRDNARSYR